MSKVFGASKPSPVFGPKGAGNHGNSDGPSVIQAYFPGGRLSETIRGWQARVGQRSVVQARGADKEHAFPTPPGFLKNRAPGSGQPLQAMVKSQMESFFQTDFSNVRVHVGPEAPSIGALAFTVGTNLYFAPGQYQPNTPGGRHLIGHELTHVVQQAQGRVSNPYGSGMAVVHDAGLEEEAERQGTLAAKHCGRSRPGSKPVQRRTAGDAGTQKANAQLGKSNDPSKLTAGQPFVQASFVGGRSPANLRVHSHAGRPRTMEHDALRLPANFLPSLPVKGGKPLPSAIQAKLEKQLRADLSGIRVYFGTQPAKIGAQMFTVGSNVYVAPGRFQPTTAAGGQLLAQQLNRVVQQSREQGAISVESAGKLANTRERRSVASSGEHDASFANTQPGKGSENTHCYSYALFGLRRAGAGSIIPIQRAEAEAKKYEFPLEPNAKAEAVERNFPENIAFSNSLDVAKEILKRPQEGWTRFTVGGWPVYHSSKGSEGVRNPGTVFWTYNDISGTIRIVAIGAHEGEGNDTYRLRWWDPDIVPNLVVKLKSNLDNPDDRIYSAKDVEPRKAAKAAKKKPPKK